MAKFSGLRFWGKAKKTSPVPTPGTAEVAGRPAPAPLRAEPIREPERSAKLPRFRATAVDQLDRRGGDASGAIRIKLRNAFTPSQPVLDQRMFAGRGEFLTRMIRSIEDQRLHLVIYGDRGIGKTSLLHMLSEAAREARYIVIYTSCGSASAFDETFRAAAKEIPLRFHSSVRPTASEAEGGFALADLLPNAEITPRLFGELCARITGTRVLIVLDEFDRAESARFRRDIAELIKVLSDRLLRVQLVVAGVAADVTDLIEHIPSIRRNILVMRVPLMLDEEIHELIANGERVAGVSFDKLARDFVTRAAHGSPYIASLLAQHAGLIALEDRRTKISSRDVAEAVGRALDEVALRINKPMQKALDKILKDEAEALTLLARASLSVGGAFEIEQIDRVATRPEEASRARKLLLRLAEDRELLESWNAGFGLQYRFTDDGVPAYLWFGAAQQEFSPSAFTAGRAASGAE